MAQPKVFSMTVEQLIQRFPKGFAISPEGQIFEVLVAKKRPQDLPIMTSPGGYLAVTAPVLMTGDEFYGQDGESVAQNLSSSEQAEEINRLIELADTVEEDEILSKLHNKYSDRLEWAARNLLDGD